MEKRSGQLWQPIQKFSKKDLLKNLDWAVQAQIQIQISAHLYKNMSELIQEGFTLEEFEELSHLLGLSSHLRAHFLLTQLALNLNEIPDLYALEQELFSLFSISEYESVLTQALDLLTQKYPQEFSQIILNHLEVKNSIGEDFKKWFVHDGFKFRVRLVQRGRAKSRASSSTVTQKIQGIFKDLLAKIS